MVQSLPEAQVRDVNAEDAKERGEARQRGIPFVVGNECCAPTLCGGPRVSAALCCDRGCVAGSRVPSLSCTSHSFCVNLGVNFVVELQRKVSSFFFR